MRDNAGFTEGLDAGAALILLATAATCLWQADRIAGWLSRESEIAQKRRVIGRAEHVAKLSADYLDRCRSAGI